MATASPSLGFSVKGVGLGVLKANLKGFKDGPRLLLSCDEVLGLLQEKLSSRFRSVREAFVHYDVDLDGYIGDPEFRTALVLMGLDMTAVEYRKLWRYFDVDGDSKISYHEWNNRVGHLIHPRSVQDLGARPDSPGKIKEWHRRALARGLVRKMGDLESAFREADSDRSGSISHQEFVQLLKRLGVTKVDDEESFQMMKKHRAPSNTTGEMTFDEFKQCVQEYVSIPPESLTVRTERETMTPASVADVERIMANQLFTKYATVQRAFRAMDEDKSGDLNMKEFRMAFEHMNLPLTDAQFAEMRRRFDPSGSGVVKYGDFNRIIGPLIHPEAKDTSKAMLAMEEASGAQEGLVFNPNARLGSNVPITVRTARKATSDSDSMLGDRAPPPPPDIDSFPLVGTEGFSATTAAGDSSRLGDDPADDEPVASDSRRGSSASSAAAGSGLRRASAAAAAGAGSLALNLTSVGGSAGPAADVGKLEERLRKVLGRGWVHVAAEVKKAAGGGRGGAMPMEQLRDLLAERGVPMTSREADALCAKYAAPQGGVDVDRLLTNTFKATFAGAPPPVKPLGGSARLPPASSSTRSLKPVSETARSGSGTPSAFIRPGTGRVGIF